MESAGGGGGDDDDDDANEQKSLLQQQQSLTPQAVGDAVGDSQVHATAADAASSSKANDLTSSLLYDDSDTTKTTQA